MRILRCGKGHFFDADKFDECPYCANSGKKLPNVDNASPAVKPSVDSNLKNSVNDLKNKNQPDDQKTISLYRKNMGVEPVVGWLVAIEGPHLGQDFRLISGRNFVGRSQTMDVALTNDNSVSREKHAIVVFDGASNMFLVQNGESHELCYLNGKVVLSPTEMRAGDELSLGATKFVLVPFCGESFSWKNED